MGARLIEKTNYNVVNPSETISLSLLCCNMGGLNKG
jgi:hypothetical protein